MGQQQHGARGTAKGGSLARMRREAQASLARLRRASVEQIRALDRQIARLGAQQQALLQDLRATLATIRAATDFGGNGSGRGSAPSKGQGPQLRLVGGPQWRVAPETVTLREMERDHIAAVLESCGWNQSRAAIQLGIGRNTLMRKVKAFGLRKTRKAA